MLNFIDNGAVSKIDLWTDGIQLHLAVHVMSGWLRIRCAIGFLVHLIHFSFYWHFVKFYFPVESSWNFWSLLSFFVDFVLENFPLLDSSWFYGQVTKWGLKWLLVQMGMIYFKILYLFFNQTFSFSFLSFVFFISIFIQF